MDVYTFGKFAASLSAGADEMRGIHKFCIQCGNQAMEEGMLPGWKLCRKCNLFIDIQEAGKFQLIQYSKTNLSKPIEVPRGTLLIVESRELR